MLRVYAELQNCSTKLLLRRANFLENTVNQKLDVTIMRSWFPKPPPATAALTGLAPCARGGLKILSVLGLPRTARRVLSRDQEAFCTTDCLVLLQEKQHRVVSGATYRGARQALPECSTSSLHGTYREAAFLSSLFGVPRQAHNRKAHPRRGRCRPTHCSSPPVR